MKISNLCSDAALLLCCCAVNEDAQKAPESSETLQAPTENAAASCRRDVACQWDGDGDHPDEPMDAPLTSAPAPSHNAPRLPPSAKLQLDPNPNESVPEAKGGACVPGQQERTKQYVETAVPPLADPHPQAAEAQAAVVTAAAQADPDAAGVLLAAAQRKPSASCCPSVVDHLRPPAEASSAVPRGLEGLPPPPPPDLLTSAASMQHQQQQQQQQQRPVQVVSDARYSKIHRF